MGIHILKCFSGERKWMVSASYLASNRKSLVLTLKWIWCTHLWTPPNFVFPNCQHCIGHPLFCRLYAVSSKPWTQKLSKKELLHERWKNNSSFSLVSSGLKEIKCCLIMSSLKWANSIRHYILLFKMFYCYRWANYFTHLRNSVLYNPVNSFLPMCIIHTLWHGFLSSTTTSAFYSVWVRDWPRRRETLPCL